MAIKRFLLFTTWSSRGVPATEDSLDITEGKHDSDTRHLDIGGYFQADHAWAGATHETAPLENMFDRGAERIFDRFGPH